MKPQSVIRGPIGFLRPIPDGVTDWSVMRSERTGENLILVGPIRFVNSDCNPNCEYDFSSSLGVFQLRTKRRITRQSELLAKYGPGFFEQNACRCRTCDIEMQAEANLEINSYIDGIISETVHDLLNEKIVSENAPTTVRPKKKTFETKRNVEMYDRKTASPVSGYQSQRSPDFTQSRYDISWKRVPSDIPCCNEKPELSESVQSSDEMSEDIQTTHIPRISSPIEYQPLACSVPTVTEGCSKEELVERRSSVMLCSGSEVTLHEATSLLELFSSRFVLSDEASLALYSITEAVLPRDNKLPSGHSLVRKMKQDLSNQTRALLTSSKGNVII